MQKIVSWTDDEKRMVGTALLEKEMRLKEQIRVASSIHSREAFEGDLQDLTSARLRLEKELEPSPA